MPPDADIWHASLSAPSAPQRDTVIREAKEFLDRLGIADDIHPFLRDQDTCTSEIMADFHMRPAPSEPVRQLVEALRGREHTQDWYARHYGKLEDWARKRLPEPWRTEFFHCVANGTWGHDDVGEPYMSMVGKITPSGYFVMDDAYKQILHNQTTRAEQAEFKLAEAERVLARYQKV